MKKDIPVMTFVFLLRFIFREHWFLSWKTHWAPQRAWHLSLWSLIDASTGLPCISMYLQIYEICRYKQKLKAQWKVQKYDWVTSLQINFHLTFCSSVSVCQAPLSSIQASKRKSRARQTLPWMVGKQTLFVLQVIFPVLFHIKKKGIQHCHVFLHQHLGLGGLKQEETQSRNEKYLYCSAGCFSRERTKEVKELINTQK